ncbi:hypothetical protein OS493_036967 [Desmophyllum pertusum]|uniref:Uncharacterized protein n=1 Tax=Desmophyllum pertusum TaxID=174260 RepID=A0A9W9ZI19_9CNID|nr:hypothetical protein OS493_036967 [Desmophyllum pertusum]
MIESMQPLNNWDHLNSDEKYVICDSLLQKTKHRNCLLIVENRNLKNKIKNMEFELRTVRDALRVENSKLVQLNEKLRVKTKERLDFLAKEEKLSRNVKTLKSKLNKEQSKLASLEEKMQMASPERTPSRALNQRFGQLMDRLKRRLGRRRNTVHNVCY